LLLQAATGVPAGNQQLEQIIIDRPRTRRGTTRDKQAAQGPPGTALTIPADSEEVATRPEARRAGTARKGPRAHQGARHPAGHKRIAPDRHGL
jgi:hypothetical protein